MALDDEVNANCANLKGYTPLLILTRFNRRNNLCVCIETLCQRPNLDINVKDRQGYNALLTVCYYFCGSKLLDSVRVLLKYGIDANATDPNGKTALYSLISNFSGNFVHFYEIVRTLVNNGLDINARTNDGTSPFVRLVSVGKMGASHYHRPDFFQVVEYLIAQGADVNAEDRRKRTALHNICSTYNGSELYTIVEMLVAANCDVKKLDRSKRKAVDYLIEKGVVDHADVIKLLTF